MRAVERAGERRAGRRPDLDAGARPGHPRHGSSTSTTGTSILLIIGGNDTTRNTISGSSIALNKNPDQYAKLRAEPGADPLDGLRDHPLADAAGAHAPRRRRRTSSSAARPSSEGDQVVMWYVSGNRDETVIDEPQRLHHRPRAAAPAPVVRLRHPPLRRQPPRRAAADHHLGRDPEALPARSELLGRAAAHLLDLRQGLREHAGGDPAAGVARRMDAELSYVKGANSPPLLEITIGQALDAAAVRWGERRRDRLGAPEHPLELGEPGGAGRRAGGRAAGAGARRRRPDRHLVAELRRVGADPVRRRQGRA